MLNASLDILMPLKISPLVTFQNVTSNPNHIHLLKALSYFDEQICWRNSREQRLISEESLFILFCIA